MKEFLRFRLGQDNAQDTSVSYQSPRSHFSTQPYLQKINATVVFLDDLSRRI